VDKERILSGNAEWTITDSPCKEEGPTERGHADLLNANADHSKFCRDRL